MDVSRLLTFIEVVTADTSIVNERGSWTIANAKSKVRDRVAEDKNGQYGFASRLGKTPLVAGSETTERPTMRSVDDAETLMKDSLTDSFSDLAASMSPRLAIDSNMDSWRSKNYWLLSQYEIPIRRKIRQTG